MPTETNSRSAKFWISFSTKIAAAEKFWQILGLVILAETIAFLILDHHRLLILEIFSSILVFYGILWLWHSSMLLRSAWAKERKAATEVDKDKKEKYLSEVSILREMRDVDRTWATALFVFAALILAVAALMK